MKIGILLPTIYASYKYNQKIFAPRILVISLADELVKLGHEVYLYSAADLKTKANLISGDDLLTQGNLFYEKLKGADEVRRKWASFYLSKNFYEMDLIQKAFLDAKNKKIDILHSYHDNYTHFFDGLVDIPVVYTIHDPLPPEGSFEYWLFNKFKDHNYVSISNNFRQSSLKLNYMATIYHGIDLEQYAFSAESNNYFIFLGRMVREKGLHTAIRTAIELKTPLLTATDFKNEGTGAYFQNEISPYLSNPLIKQTGFIDNEAKTKSYQGARALLFPIEWEEPFGMVMIEAMACGTPVVAFRRGSVPEIVKDGITGFLVDPKEGEKGFIQAAQKILSLPADEYRQMRQNCRKLVEESFTNQIAAKNYEKVYQKIIRSFNPPAGEAGS